MVDQEKLFQELSELLSNSEELVSSDNTCIIKVLNNVPNHYGVYLIGATIFKYRDGTSYRHNILKEHYSGDYLQFASDEKLKCVESSLTAVIAKSRQYPGEGKYAQGYKAPKDECMLQRGFAIGPKEDVAEGSGFFESYIGLAPS